VNIGIGRKQTKLYEEAGLDEVSLDPYSFTKDRFLKCFEAAAQQKTKRKISALSKSNYEKLLAFRNAIRDYVGLPANSTPRIGPSVNAP
jgi:hypothetical protein